MKDKNKSNYEKMQAWQDFTNISEGTKYAKSGARMVYKFSKKALRELDKELKKEELEVDRNYKKIVNILDKILSLQLNKKKKAKYQKRRDVYAKKLDDDSKIKNNDLTKEASNNIHKQNDDNKSTDDIVKHKPNKNLSDKSSNSNNKPKDTKVESVIHSSISHKHPLSGKSLIEFRALVYNNEVTKINMLDVFAKGIPIDNKSNPYLSAYMRINNQKEYRLIVDENKTPNFIISSYRKT